ncbi:hypothetical protein P168DRAFT_317920 [Aspergillus campestris IBT 28561]|uniref:Ribosomal protein eL8/eL30/eS12/Gadd45 domain-containing protein n=1 Tax=Aspergillus campestris (strain IBT 28561) TaxID=1392248 RepID=A0A2I1D4S8_ASPC2|nr:uncharacterized protein P168DRAFT_317920 [Aspergillus campestris IBT 28561]PKY04882.1 hypothetical protein P168DRAFT_317920 [Aspergillus campestris IBT 28561]
MATMESSDTPLVASRLTVAVKSGRVTVGTDNTLRALLHDNASLILIAENCPPILKAEVVCRAKGHPAQGLASTQPSHPRRRAATAAPPFSVITRFQTLVRTHLNGPPGPRMVDKLPLVLGN